MERQSLKVQGNELVERFKELVHEGNVRRIVVKQGDSETSNCKVKSLSGFSSPVTLSCSGQAAGVTCAFNPATVTPPNGGTVSSVLTVTININGSSTFQIVGTSGSLVNSTSMTVKGH